VQPAGILGKRAFPRDRHGKEKGIETGIIETLAEIAPGRDNDALLGLGNRRKTRGDVAALLLAFTPTTPEPNSGKLSSDKFLWAATNDLVETPFPASDVITMRCIERPTYFVALKIEFRFLSQGLEGTRSTRAMSLCETELASPSSQEMVTSLQDVPVTEPRSVIAAPQQTRSSGLRSLDWSPVIGLALSYWL
jgi:hypothetical protein